MPKSIERYGLGWRGRFQGCPAPCHLRSARLRRAAPRPAERHPGPPSGYDPAPVASILITGGAGFVGVNVADQLAANGHSVDVLDDLRRPGSDRNAAWLTGRHPETVRLVRAALADRDALSRCVRGRDAVIHLAAQVAVTASLRDPLEDCAVNALGTLHVLEAIRLHAPEAAVLYASTNKVYGELAGRGTPVGEDVPLDPRTPYGCSKAAADQYVRDYHHTFGLRTVVFRQSCVYGPHQYGTEDQGWVAHFAHAILAGRPLTVYGDGRQVRDLLEVSDLARLYALAIAGIDRCAGLAVNVGGGPGNARDVVQVIGEIETLTGLEAGVGFAARRPGDQRYFVTDLSLARATLGWAPETGVPEGLARLVAWARTLTGPPAPNAS